MLALLSQALGVLDQYESGGPAATEAAAQRVGGLVIQHCELLTKHDGTPVVRESLGLVGRVIAVTAWANQNQGMVALLLGLGGSVNSILLPIATPSLTEIGNNIAGLLGPGGTQGAQ